MLPHKGDQHERTRVEPRNTRRATELLGLLIHGGILLLAGPAHAANHQARSSPEVGADRHIRLCETGRQISVDSLHRVGIRTPYVWPVRSSAPAKGAELPCALRVEASHGLQRREARGNGAGANQHASTLARLAELIPTPSSAEDRHPKLTLDPQRFVCQDKGPEKPPERLLFEVVPAPHEAASHQDSVEPATEAPPPWKRRSFLGAVGVATLAAAAGGGVWWYREDAKQRTQGEAERASQQETADDAARQRELEAQEADRIARRREEARQTRQRVAERAARRRWDDARSIAIEIAQGDALTFGPNGDQLAQANQQALEKAIRPLLEELPAWPSAAVRVRGVTDPSGSREANIDLANRRAQHIRDLLLQWDGPAQQILVGEPLVDNARNVVANFIAEPTNAQLRRALIEIDDRGHHP